jgi:hypothetical protein
MCHLSLEVWINIPSVYLFVLFVVLLVFVCIYLFLSVYKFFSFCCYVVIWATYIVTVDCISLVCLTCLNSTYH